MLSIPPLWRYEHVVVLTAALLPTYLIRFTVFGIPTNFLEGAIAALFMYGLLQHNVRQEWGQAWRSFPRPLVTLLGLFLLASLISVFVSPHLRTSLGVLKGWIIVPIFFGWIIYATGSSKLQITNYRLQITDSLILSGLIVALLAISQIGTYDRIRSIYDVPNSLALFLSPLIVLSAWQALFVPRRSIQITNYQLPITNYYFLSSLIMFLALLATRSVGGILAVLISLAVGLAINYKLQITNYKLHAIVVVTILFLASLPVLLNKAPYLLQPNSSAAVRLQLWSISWELIKEHPLLGIGLGTFESAYQQKLHKRFAEYEQSKNKLQITNYQLQTPIHEFVFRDPHNWILSFWLNTGLLGLLAFAGMHFWVFMHFYKLQITNYKSQATVLALLTLLLFGLTDTIFWKNDLAGLHWLLISIILATLNTAKSRR